MTCQIHRSQTVLKYCFGVVGLSVLSAVMIAGATATAWAQVPVATAPYSVTTFATAPTGLSAPDSVTFSATNVFIGYGNNGAPDGPGTR